MNKTNLTIAIGVFFVFMADECKSNEEGGFSDKKENSIHFVEKTLKINDEEGPLLEKELHKKYKNEKAVSNKIEYNGYEYLFFIFDLPSYGVSKKRMEGWYSYHKGGKWIKFIYYNIYNKNGVRGRFDKKSGKYIIVGTSYGSDEDEEIISLLLAQP